MANEPSAPRRLSKGVIIRLAIYVPLLGFFGWRAADKAITEREASDDMFRDDLDRLLEIQPQVIDLSKMIPVDAQAELSAPPSEPATTGGTTTGGTTTGDPALDATSTSTTSGTTGEPEPDATGTSSTTSTTGEPEPAASTSTTTSTGP